MKTCFQNTMLVLVALFLVIGTASTSFATVDCASAKVLMVGPAPGYGGDDSAGIKVKLRNDAGNDRGDWAMDTTRFFFLTNDLGDRGMATLLTALSLPKNVWVRIGGNAEVGSLISIIYLTD